MPKAGRSGAAFVTGTLILLGVALGILSTSRAARAGDASIIIDADTGAVLEQHNADEQNYPASLTKMMTLYLTFEALHNGKLTLGQALPVSAHAASRAPSKLG